MAEESSYKQRVAKRLWSQFEDIRNANMKGVWNIHVDDTNIWKWGALIVPDSDPYNKGAFRIEISIPDGFPFKPPKILFLTKIHHPNVDEEGYIHLEVLSQWTYIMEIEAALRGLVDVVNEPEPFHPRYHREIYKLSLQYYQNRSEFIKSAREMTERFSEKRPDNVRPPPKEVGKVAKRLREELQEIREANFKRYKNIQVDDIWTWRILLVPDAGPYNKGAYRIEINFRPEYPLKPPIMIFLTKIYHPNVYDCGKIDMREICSEWNHTRKMIEVFHSLLGLLNQPDPIHFPNTETAGAYCKDREVFRRTAEEFSEQFAEKITDECCEPEGRCLPFAGSYARTERDIIVSPEISEKGQCHTSLPTQPLNNDEETAMAKGAEGGAFSTEMLVEGKNVKSNK